MRALATLLATLLTATPALPATPALQAPASPAKAPAARPTILFWTINQKYVDALVLHVPQPNALRLAQLRKSFDDLECKPPQLRDEEVAEGKNLLCTLPGTSTDTIVVTAHYEHEGKGTSAVENWSGALMLPFLYHALTAAPRKHTFLFAALYGETGAKALLNSMPRAQRRSIKTVLALDALGLGPLRFYFGPADPFPSQFELYLQRQLVRAAYYNKSPAPEGSIPGGWFKVDVTRQFRYQGFPTLLVHSVDSAKRRIPGSVDDTPQAIDTNVYFQTYNLLCYYLVNLDQTPVKDDKPDVPVSTRHR